MYHIPDNQVQHNGSEKRKAGFHCLHKIYILKARYLAQNYWDWVWYDELWILRRVHMWYHPPRSLLFFIKIIGKQNPNPIIVLLFITAIFSISKQAPAFIKCFPVFWQFQDMKWCLYILANTCILWKVVVICEVVILVFLLCSRVAVKAVIFFLA